MKRDSPCRRRGSAHSSRQCSGWRGTTLYRPRSGQSLAEGSWTVKQFGRQDKGLRDLCSGTRYHLPVRSVVGLVLAGLLQASQFELDCGKPEAARSLIGRARLSEIEWAADVNREAMWQAFGGCTERADAEACRDMERQRFAADVRALRAA